MMTNRRLVHGAVGMGLALIAGAVGCSMGAVDDDATGVAQIAITQVPLDGSVGCIAVTATGATTVTKRSDVTPGASTVMSLNALPTGTVSFTGDAYAGACKNVTGSSVPTWISDPVLASVSHVPVSVTLSMRRNGAATVGVDFPDPSCSADGVPCFVDSECCAGSCAGNICQPACDADAGACGCAAGQVDCGGTCADLASDPMNCGACGMMCQPGGACVSGACMQPPVSCTDGMRNGAETDVDCGGSCAPCAIGKQCAASSDCQSAVCRFGICSMPTCTDAVKNGTETDVDCGGSCAKCASGKQCVVNADCASGICLMGGDAGVGSVCL
jgi:hypothetical protein